MAEKLTEEKFDALALKSHMYYKVTIPGAGEPLYMRTIQQIAEVIRELYPHAKNWTAVDLRKKSEQPGVIVRACALCERSFEVGQTENHATFCSECWADPECWTKLEQKQTPVIGA